jgi:hypothetical protein
MFSNFSEIQNYYIATKENVSKSLEQSKKKLLSISIARFVVLIVAMYFIVLTVRSSNNLYLYVTLICSIIFIFLVNMHGRMDQKIKYDENIFNINNEELSYLNEGQLSFHNGQEFTDPRHAFTYDLDFFGDKSLYHHICRAYTHKGKYGLANLLMSTLPENKIIANQQAIIEISPKIEWRQKFTAIARMNEDTKLEYDKVLHWASVTSKNVSIFSKIAAYIIPVLFFLALGACIFTESFDYFHYVTSFFTLNLVLAGTYFKEIKNEISNSSNITATIKKNAQLLSLFEAEKFTNEKYTTLQQSLVNENQTASKAISALSSLFSSLDTVLNPMGMILSNGSMQFHLHTYDGLQKWKKSHAAMLPKWLDTVSELEIINSLANFHYNNPEFTFPSLNNTEKISFEALGHPLIHRSKRVCNDVGFIDHQFIVLTGSNMSGKSTFLRSLGVNMVLSGIGSCICAKDAAIHPLPVLVAMRQSDSLADGESYFFAEVKRLHDTMLALNGKGHFVLLDEILRGTNSDDKRSGTIGVIEKMVAYKSIGAIATHDIEVCNISEKYPQHLINQCFEVEILKDELYFDYKLKNGVCKNKSATFLMKKMGVIQ